MYTLGMGLNIKYKYKLIFYIVLNIIVHLVVCLNTQLIFFEEYLIFFLYYTKNI